MFVNCVEYVIVGKDYFIGELCECYVNCVNLFCNKKMICILENEYKYMCSCSYECCMNLRNLYVLEYNMIEEEVNVRLVVIEKEEYVVVE